MEANKFAFALNMQVGVAYSVDLPALIVQSEKTVTAIEWSYIIEEEFKIDASCCYLESN